MANEIWHSYDEASSLYAVIWRASDNKVWHDTGELWDDYLDANIDQFDIPLTTQAEGSGESDYHSADFPVAITDFGVYRVQVFLQVGGALDADADIAVSQGEIHWSGTDEITLSSIFSLVLNIYNENEQ